MKIFLVVIAIFLVGCGTSSTKHQEFAKKQFAAACEIVTTCNLSNQGFDVTIDSHQIAKKNEPVQVVSLICAQSTSTLVVYGKDVSCVTISSEIEAKGDTEEGSKFLDRVDTAEFNNIALSKEEFIKELGR